VGEIPPGWGLEDKRLLLVVAGATGAALGVPRPRRDERPNQEAFSFRQEHEGGPGCGLARSGSKGTERPRPPRASLRAASRYEYTRPGRRTVPALSSRKRDTAGDGIGGCRGGSTRLSRLAGGRRGGAAGARRPTSQVVAGAPVSRRREGRGRASGASPLVSAHSDYVPQSSAGAAALRGSRCSRAGARTAPGRQQAGRRRPRRFRGLGLDHRRRKDRGDGGVSRGTHGTPSDFLAPGPPLRRPARPA
jgi:hypothetical protein